LLAAVNFNQMTPKEKAVELVRRFNSICTNQSDAREGAILVVDLICSDDVDSRKKQYWKDVRMALERIF